MCSLTWYRQEKKLHLFFNRDELRSRSIAEPPSLQQTDGVKVLSPRDPDAGGTWMFANEYGIIACLLNRWHENEWRAKAPPVSRGQLMSTLSSSPSLQKLEETLSSSELRHTNPFTIIAFNQENEKSWGWSDGKLFAEHIRQPLTSSSFQFEKVSASRRKEYKNLHSLLPESLHDYHLSTGLSLNAHTVRMCRPDAQTWSRSEIVLDSESIQWAYSKESPYFAQNPTLHSTDLFLKTL